METDVVKTENAEELTAEQKVEGIELTDTTEQEKAEVKMYSEEEFNSKLDDILSKKIARERRRIEREYDNKYADYVEVGKIVSKGLDTKDIRDAKNKVKEFYEEQGVSFEESVYNDDEAKVLGNNDARVLLDLGLDIAEDEANRLAEIGYDNLSTRDKQKFNILAKTLEDNKNKQELKSMGVDDAILENTDFQQFASQFNSKTPVKNIYEIYKKTQPQKEVHIIGSMAGNATKPEKEYYTEAELSKLTVDELKNPEVWEKARKSMIKY